LPGLGLFLLSTLLYSCCSLSTIISPFLLLICTQ
jgi:hypothetical protein